MLLSRSVLGKVMSFFVSYIWLVFGFMMAFIILFSNYRNFSEFPGPLVHTEYYIHIILLSILTQVSILDMMLGELEFREVYYPSNTNIVKNQRNTYISNQTNNTSPIGNIIGSIELENKYQQFPGFNNNKKEMYMIHFSSRNINVLPHLVCHYILHCDHEPLGE